MSALKDLVAAELSKIGTQAMNGIDDQDEWLLVNGELSKAWNHLHAGRFEEAADHGRRASRKTAAIVKEQSRNA